MPSRYTNTTTNPPNVAGFLMQGANQVTPYYQDDRVTLYHGHALDVLEKLPEQSVDCIVTSPPYYGLRDYGEGEQIGLEETPAEFVAALVDVFREARRVLADDGTFWLNLGDSYAASATNNGGYGASSAHAGHASENTKGRRANDSTQARKISPGVPAKNLLGIPWRVAFALQDDGWILRNEIIWHKPTAMPESAKDRLTRDHEHIFLFVKQPRYHYDADAIAEPVSVVSLQDLQRRKNTTNKGTHGNVRADLGRDRSEYLREDGKRNARTVWSLRNQPFPGAHFATFPLALPERGIQAGCKPGGTVLDPFSGSGTTGLAAAKHGRRYVGIDLNHEYLDLSLRTRLQQPGLDLEGVSA